MTKYVIACEGFPLYDTQYTEWQRLAGRVLICLPNGNYRVLCISDKTVFDKTSWYWYPHQVRKITEEQALDPNFRKFMYKIYSGDPDGELDEIL